MEDPHASLPLPAAAALSQPPSPPATSPPLCRPSSPGALARPSSVGCLAPSAARPSRPPGPRQECRGILTDRSDIECIFSMAGIDYILSVMPFMLPLISTLLFPVLP